MPALHVNGEDNVGESLMRAAGEVKLSSLHKRCLYAELAVDVIRIHVYSPFVRGQVHLGRVVTPGAEHQGAFLLVKGVVGDVNLAHRFEHSPWFPADLSAGINDGLELIVLLVQTLSAGSKTYRNE